MPLSDELAKLLFEKALETAWTFGPVPEAGPPELDTGEEILSLLARLACLIPMQQARLQMMELPEHIRTEQRKWLRNLVPRITEQGQAAAYHQENLRRLGYGKKSILR